MHEIDSTGVGARRRGRLHRRVYMVQGANHLWHVDTNHKLIRWSFVIAAGIDGFSRLVTFVKCLNNNRASSLLLCFKEGVEKYGLPLRVRTDKGMENVEIADFMIEKRGPSGILTGKSVHNQRIERLWRDLYEGVLDYYYQLFYYMEDQGILDVMNELHIFALHYVYTQKINKKLCIWKEAWASHRLRTVRTSPLQLYTSSMINNPVNDNEFMEEDDTSGLDIETDTDTRPIVESIQLHFGERIKQTLEHRCPEDWYSDNFGIDIFLRAVEILSSDLI